MYVTNSGNIDYRQYAQGFIGFRPIICLKSDVELEKQSDETYLIK